MKTLAIWTAVFGIGITACSQDIAASKVPSVITNALQAKFSTATNVEWEKKKNMYEAEFMQDSVEVTAEIDAAGKIVRQKQDLPVAQIPASISQVISSQYKDYTIDDVEKVEMNGTIFYQVELEAPRGKKDVQLVLDANGSTTKNEYWD